MTAREEDIPLEEVVPGERLRVRPGEKVPVDGIVTRGPQRGRRVDDHRRVDAGRKSAGRQGHRRHRQRHRQPRHARRAGRQRDAAGADRRAGRRRPALAGRRSRASPIRSRPGSCPPSSWLPSLTFVVWSIFGPPPAIGFALAQCGRGADHRLPLRAGPGDPDVDHGRHRARRARRRARHERRSARSCWRRSTRWSSTRPAP